MMIKLGLNSLYGKTAQQIGARDNEDGEIEPPPFFQMEWAGWVTAGCRAKLMQAAIQNPTAIIAMATDGIYSTEPLDLWCPSEKILGAWEFTKHAGITMVMPGVYWIEDENNGKRKLKHFSRGFNKEQMSDVDFVHQAWKWRRNNVDVSIQRLIGLGTAVASDAFWLMRGCFVTSQRDLRLDGGNSKRYPAALTQCTPWKNLVSTVPVDHDLEGLEDNFVSAPYQIAWLDDEVADPWHDLDGEAWDDAESLDADLA
jgi:hypothetical protein